MSTTELVQEQAAERELRELCEKVHIEGSSYCAFLVAVKHEPKTIDALLAVIDIPETPAGQLRTFNACADAFAVYRDGHKRGMV